MSCSKNRKGSKEEIASLNIEQDDKVMTEGKQNSATGKPTSEDKQNSMGEDVELSRETSTKHVAYGFETGDVTQKYQSTKRIKKSGLEEVRDNIPHSEGS